MIRGGRLSLIHDEVTVRKAQHECITRRYREDTILIIKLIVLKKKPRRTRKSLLH
jgi:hypothetical protein